jgi:hypothetical protein
LLSSPHSIAIAALLSFCLFPRLFSILHLFSIPHSLSSPLSPLSPLSPRPPPSTLPRASSVQILDTQDCHFSFAGLKTAVRLAIQKAGGNLTSPLANSTAAADIAASFQVRMHIASIFFFLRSHAHCFPPRHSHPSWHVSRSLSTPAPLLSYAAQMRLPPLLSVPCASNLSPPHLLFCHFLCPPPRMDIPHLASPSRFFFNLIFFSSTAPRAHPSFLVSPDLSTWPSGIWRTEWRAQSSCAALTRLSPTSTALSCAAASPPISKFAGKKVRRLACLQIAVYTRAY